MSFRLSHGIVLLEVFQMNEFDIVLKVKEIVWQMNNTQRMELLNWLYDWFDINEIEEEEE